ncbi:hypothetical protein JTE90_025155 [Oedothorax gibbosus]|uniref:Uncharacterized protein n=1 Tax=Oedothorax gibbosus TaxID=931172 RepID=A0AAV6UHA8_9ARAC|nr:hypothetical protein JTE90_025155 [Oedothorax gibbosus]
MNIVTHFIGPKTFCSNFVTELLNVAPEESRKYFSLFLNSQQRSALFKLCQYMKGMSLMNPHDFIRQLVNKCPYLSLEELWILQSLRVLPLEIYLANLDPETLAEFKKSMLELCLFDSNEDVPKEFVQTGLLLYFVRNAVNSSDGAIKEISNCIIRSYIEDIFTHQSENQIDKRAKSLYSLFNCGTIEKSSLDILFVNTLTYFTKMSSESVFEAFAIQENCHNNENPFHVCCVLQNIMGKLGRHFIENLLFEVLLAEATNQKNFMVLVHAFIKTYGQAQIILSKHIGEIVKKYLQNSDAGYFLKAILIGRQSLLALNAPDYYAGAYKQLFTTQFGDHPLLKNPQTFRFFLGVLSELVPYEKNVEILKVCLDRIFAVPSECQDAYSDYRALLKTRINDLEPRVQPEDVIDKLLTVYEQSGKIPSYVLEVSLVRKHYFLNEFLPVLLSPRVLPAIPDLRNKFIDDLDKAGKIPPQMMQKYKAMCYQLKKSQLSGT